MLNEQKMLWTSRHHETRDLLIVFFVRIESRIKSAVRFVFESNLRIASAVYTTQAVTQPDGLQAK